MFTASGVTESELRDKGRKVVRRAGKQILLIASGEALFATANRCPHEGYPLSEGTLDATRCVLTCNWHNWKFDLASGDALVGRDPVRRYALEVRSGEIFVDLSDPPAEAQRDRALKGLVAAMGDNDRPRMAREVARLERAGFDAGVALVHAIGAANEKLEFGTTHAHAAAADWLALAARAPSDAARLTAMIEPVAHLAWDTLGAGRYPYPEETKAWDADAFLDAIESENEAEAAARLRGALAEGKRDELRRALGRVALSHYADFGHSAIYALKTQQLIARLGPEAEAPVLLALVRALVNATREDRLPEFRAYAGAVAAWDGAGMATARAEDFVGLSVDAALKRVLESSGRDPREVYDALLGAAAFNLLRFDTRVDGATDNAIADNASWLDFTHALTFANAARHICGGQPELWRQALLQMALFVGRNKAYVRTQQDVAAWRVESAAGFIASEMDGLFDHGIVEPIIACHRLKMLFALEDELAAVPDAPWRDEMCAAMNRWLHTPQKRHHGLRLATQAQDFIAREG
ncbi:MAG TPA: Rieske (2Fe-2S) protein [Rhizomicrobium sp.]|jgi:nitrite reductase/ring-hydroxylating ferredoxin subunit|nr:Rieske (2Fe-2S) protein [Rhizomicrobium sp.]